MMNWIMEFNFKTKYLTKIIFNYKSGYIASFFDVELYTNYVILKFLIFTLGSMWHLLSYMEICNNLLLLSKIYRTSLFYYC